MRHVLLSLVVDGPIGLRVCVCAVCSVQGFAMMSWLTGSYDITRNTNNTTNSNDKEHRPLYGNNGGVKARSFEI